MKKIILIIDAIILMVSLTVLVFVIGYSNPLVISPINDFETSESQILFSFEKADSILIDDNPNFTSPDKIFAKDNLMVNLEPGIYYWKVQGTFSSETRKLTIEDRIDLKIIEEGSNYSLVNAGNTALKVKVYNGENLVSELFLDRDESKKLEGDRAIGGINE